MKKAFLELHLSVLLAGWTGIFGKLISLSPGLIVFWRIVIAGALLWGWLTFRKRMEFVPTKDRIGIALVGALLMLQWTLFYASIKASNVSIAIVAFASIGFFTAIIEPILTRSRISLKEIASPSSSTSTPSTGSASFSASSLPPLPPRSPSSSESTRRSTVPTPS